MSVGYNMNLQVKYRKTSVDISLPIAISSRNG